MAKRDRIAPVLTISSDVSSLIAGETALISFSFTEPPIGFSLSDIQVTGGTISNLSGSGIVWTAVFTPTANIASGNATISVANGSFQDAASNLGIGASLTPISFDTLAPNLSISNNLATLKSGQTATISFDFSEDPGSSFSLADIVVSGGTLSGLSGSGLTRTAIFTPDENQASATAIISVAAGTYQDAAGNLGLAATSSAIAIDTLAPTLSISSNRQQLAAGEAALLTFSFSETPRDFDLSDIQVSYGSLSNFQASNPNQFQALFYPDAELANVVAEIQVLNDSYQDAMGNAGTGNATSITIDTQAPTLTISCSTTELKINQQAQLSFHFSEIPVDFTINDLQVNHGFIVDLTQSSSDPTIYYATLIPQYNLAGDWITLNLPAGSYRDSAGNLGQAAQMPAIWADTRLPQIQLAELDSVGGRLVIDGANTGDLTGYSVSGAGDVNGDGRDDVIIGAPSARVNGEYDAGCSYVVFGTAESLPINLQQIQAGYGGFAIYGYQMNQRIGSNVSGAGDVNGDGYADLLVGSEYGQQHFVVYGQAWGESVYLQQISQGLSSQGFSINGDFNTPLDYSPVAAAGDVNGDGLADILIGTPLKDSANGSNNAGGAYVLFGQANNHNINLDQLTPLEGLLIAGQTTEEWAGKSVASAGDINGDGLADMIVSAPWSNQGIGKSYVVFGQSSGGLLDLAQIEMGNGGFVIYGEPLSLHSGFDVSAAGDVNGDGLSDLIIGSPGLFENSSGSSYVVFGKQDGAAVNLSDIRAGLAAGFAITDQATSNSGDLLGFSVSAAGDANGDGLADLLVGAWASDSVFAQEHVGASYVVYGKADSTSVDLAQIKAGNGGFTLIGEATEYRSGFDVSAAGDVDGDGLADFLIGAPGDWGANGYNSGSAYIVFGRAITPYQDLASRIQGSAADDWLMGSAADDTIIAESGHDWIWAGGGQDVIYAGNGNDTISLNNHNWQALTQGPSSTHYARIDGGGGFDTLVLEGDNNDYDLRQVANQGGGGLYSLSRLESIEHIQLNGHNNSLQVFVDDIQDMNAFNQFNQLYAPSLGWISGSYQIKAQENYHQLIVSGAEGNSLSLSDGNWQHQGNVYRYSSEYQVYTDESNHCQILVESNLAIENIANVVVFDLVQGVSSDHSNRSFDPNQSYTIYIMVNSENANLSTDGFASNPNASWGVWSGAENLAADDKVVLVGDGRQILGWSDLPCSQSMTWQQQARTWLSAQGAVAALDNRGQFLRFTRHWNDNTQIWSGQASPQLQMGFINSMPSAILVSQGLI